jgi:hypothetical protein
MFISSQWNVIICHTFRQINSHDISVGATVLLVGQMDHLVLEVMASGLALHRQTLLNLAQGNLKQIDMFQYFNIYRYC